MEIKQLIDNLDTKTLLARPLSDWRPILCEECQVYVFSEGYVAKRFDAINYKFCDADSAKEILIDNLYALLRYKYFKKYTEEIDDRIDKIIKSFTTNLKTTLKRVSFDKDSDTNIVSFLPDSCIAFRNGVFDFKNNKWLFKYDIVKLESLSNTIYMYDTKWIIMWYLDYEFEGLDINIEELELKDFMSLLKELTKTNRDYCFELMYNMSHNSGNKFDFEKFEHLCEVIGYTLLQSFSQHFVLLIGAGQNGKNSLFDGCFTYKVVPKPAANDMNSIENDRFITGALENRCHNLFLETDKKVHNDSKMIKALTGSMYQTIEAKGVNKYSGLINCKYIFAGNDQDDIKFSDTSTGFKRRINVFETYYQWDADKRFLKKGDYYDTSFSEDLSDLKEDMINITTFVYLAMYGIKSATNDFTRSFKFSKNDWRDKYADINLDMKEKIESITIDQIVSYIGSNQRNYEEGKFIFFDINKNRLYNSRTIKELGYAGYDEMIDMFKDPEITTAYFVENDVYMSVRMIQILVKYLESSMSFSQEFKKIYKSSSFENIYNNKPYVKCTFLNNKLHIIG